MIVGILCVWISDMFRIIPSMYTALTEYKYVGLITFAVFTFHHILSTGVLTIPYSESRLPYSTLPTQSIGKPSEGNTQAWFPEQAKRHMRVTSRLPYKETTYYATFHTHFVHTICPSKYRPLPIPPTSADLPFLRTPPR